MDSTKLSAAIAWAKALPLTVDHNQDVRMAGVRLAAHDIKAQSWAMAQHRDCELVLAAHEDRQVADRLMLERRSNFFGKPGDGKVVTLKLRLIRSKALPGEWGVRTYFWFRHPEDARMVRYCNASGKAPELVVNQVYVVRGVVKEHLSGSQVPEPTTVMTRCTIEPVGD